MGQLLIRRGVGGVSGVGKSNQLPLTCMVICIVVYNDALMKRLKEYQKQELKERKL